LSENIVLILVGALVLLVLVLVGVILYLFNKILQEKDMTQAPEHATEPSRNRQRVVVDKGELKAQAADVSLSYCANHPQDHAKGMCSICQECFCEECIKEHDGLTFCNPHFRLYISHEWTELETIKTTPDTPETAFPIYDFKKLLWEEEGLPAVISTHYKINIDTDTIESFVKLLVRTDELDSLSERYNKFKH
jgi:hypothetical protein